MSSEAPPPDQAPPVGPAAAVAPRTAPGEATLQLLTVNVTSWTAMEDWVLQRHEDVICVQETRLEAAAMAGARRRAQRAGWGGVWRAAVPSRLGGTATGGLAILTRGGRRIQEVPVGAEQPHRWLSAAVETGRGHPLHVTTVYGSVGNPRANRRLFQAVFEHQAALGPAHWACAGDWNEEAEAVWPIVADGGRHIRLPRSPVPDPHGTCTPGRRRIDFWALSASLQGRAGQERILLGEPPRPHRPVKLALRIGGESAPTPGLDLPQAYPEDALDPRHEDVGFAAEQVLGAQAVWQHRLQANDLDGLWELWNRLAEQYLDHQSGNTSHKLHGRGRVRQRRWLSEVGPRQGNQDGAGTAVATDYRYIANGLRELERLHRQEPVGAAAVRAAVLTRLGQAAARVGAPWPDRVRAIADMLPAHWLAWSTEAEAARSRELSGVHKARRAAWRTWVQEAVSKRPGLLFRWARGDPPVPTMGVCTDGQWSLCPARLLGAAAEAWQKLWNPPGGRGWTPRAPEAADLPPLDPAGLRDIAQHIPSAKAGGLDGWRVAELKALPLPHWRLLGQLLELCERVGDWPAGFKQAAVSLLPKEGETDVAALRPVTILPLPYRIWAVARRPAVKHWEGADGADGAEEPGVGADQAAWQLAAEAETQRLQGRAMAGIFLDCSKCYDRVSHVQLDDAARRLRFPDPLLVLALRIYGAPRRLRLNGGFSDERTPTHGITAGCGLAVALLRAYLHDAVTRVPPEAAGDGETVAVVRRYVDDLVIWAAGPPKAAARAVCIRFHTVAGLLAARGMHLNTKKSGMVAAPASCAAHARRYMRSSGIAVVPTVRDLGLDTSWSRRRQGTRQKRLAKQRTPAYRISCLPVQDQLRANMASSLLNGGGLYGVGAEGVSRTAEDTLRTLVHIAVVPGSRGRRCRHADLIAAGDPSQLDPGERSVWEVLKAWRRRVPSLPDPALLAEAWSERAARPHRGILGPIAATQAVLRRLGWDAQDPWAWRDREGRAVPLWAGPELKAVVHRDYQAVEWARVAAGRRDFAGTEGGIDEDATYALLRKWRKRKQGKKVGLLRCILSGGTWHQHRLHDAYPERHPSATCPACGEADETAAHRWWDCPAREMDRRAAEVDDVARMARHDLANEGSMAALWLNGTLPKGVIPVARSPFMDLEEEAEDPLRPPAGPDAPPPAGAAAAPARVPPEDSLVDVFTDGAATHPKHAVLRRAGWAFVSPGHNAARSAPVRGPIQTAYRGEIRASVAAAEALPGGLRIWTDNLGVVRGWARIARGDIPRGSHRDLWERAASAANGRPVQVHWIKSHMDQATAVSAGWTAEQWAGNAAADEAAGAAAKRHAVPEPVAQDYLGWLDIVTRVQAHMVSTLQQCAHQRPPAPAARRRRGACTRRPALRRVRRPCPPAVGPHRRIETRPHEWVCLDCHRRVSRRGKWGVWRRLPCARARRSYPLHGSVPWLPQPGPGEPPLHVFRTVDGRTSCERCGASRVQRWRARLGTHCAGHPPADQAAAGAPAGPAPGGPPGAAGPPGAPAGPAAEAEALVDAAPGPAPLPPLAPPVGPPGAPAPAAGAGPPAPPDAVGVGSAAGPGPGPLPPVPVPPPPPPPLPPPAAAPADDPEGEPPLGPFAAFGPAPAPAGPVAVAAPQRPRRRRSRWEIQQLLDSHELAEEDGWLRCTRCMARQRPRQRYRFAWCPLAGAAEPPVPEGGPGSGGGGGGGGGPAT